ncbi:PEP-CTERM sorting domain-containing protein [Massilia sp. LC238]|uniref:PEP-CTERM sorting domain-containing protein n=1 Tax=Massilia sp. LC238 TaxID=1502852 RepID=UPI0004E2ECF5|nr:PEP-CTERM sorting domain-containing protein [Massilia sp. LC238]KFC71531.1 hypothetical protein FG94_02320 [Massilia sp. LC238]
MKTDMRLQALAIACALASAPALADVQGQATLGNLRFTLIDLDPNDAVTPSLEWVLPQNQGWSGSNGYMSVMYDASSTDWSWGEYYNRYANPEARQPAQIDYAPGPHVSLSTAYAHPDPLGQLLSLSVETAPPAGAYTHLTADVRSEQLGFWLSPNTRVSLSVDMNGSAGAEEQDSHSEYLRLLLGFGVVDYLTYGNRDEIRVQRETGTAAGLAPGFAETGTLTVDFSNPYGYARWADLQLSLGAEAWASPISAVPEPSSHAMLLAGAALLGWRRARTQRRIDRPTVKATSGVRLLSPRDSIASSCTSFDRR